MVKYLHVRMVDSEGHILPNGGITVAYTCTLKDIVLQTAACHDNDLFCFRVGREIAGGRLKSPKHEATILELKHPITQTIVDWLALEWFEVPVHIYLDEKGRWVSTFDPDESLCIVEDADWANQIPLETGTYPEITEKEAFQFPMLEGDQGLRYAG